MKIVAFDHIELFVENAERTAAHLCAAYDFVVHGRGGPETGLAGCRSILLRQRDITLLITSAIDDGHRAATYVDRHGDGVAVLGLAVTDAAAAFAGAIEQGAPPLAPPTVVGSGDASVTFASVEGHGGVEICLISRSGKDAPFLPGLIEESGSAQKRSGLLETIDHLAVLVPAGELDATVYFYRDVFGFDQIYEEKIQVGRQSMNSKVVANADSSVTLTVIEPEVTGDPGQIDTFIDAHGGAGIQHVAFRTSDIVQSVRSVSAAGVRFLSTPATYYDVLADRVGQVGVPISTLRELNILADRDQWGTILQIFTESEHQRRTLFYELISRRGARTFGSNNIRALYEAVERQLEGRPSVTPAN